MKKVSKLIALASTALLTTGCNMRLVGDYSFNHIHIQMNPGEPVYHFEIKSWTDSEDDGCEVKLKDGTSMFVYGSYLLYDSDKCPLCNK